MRVFALQGLIVAAAVAAAASQASAQEVRLVTTTMSAPTSHNTVHIFRPWAKKINDQGKGVIAIDLRDGFALANFSNVYERVLNDAVQIGWAIHGIVAGKFPRSEVAALPFVADNAEEGSVALWRLFRTGLLDDEYREVVPLMFTLMPQYHLHFTKPLASVENLNGLKVSASGRTHTKILELLGATPISLPTQDLYTALQRSTIDGTLIAWSGFDTFKLGEVTAYHVESRLGAGTSMVFMSRKRYDALPAAARKILADNTPESATRTFGHQLDARDEIQRQLILKSDKHKVVQLSAAQNAQWHARVAPMVEEWTKSRPNGAKLLETYKSILAEVRSDFAKARR